MVASSEASAVHFVADSSTSESSSDFSSDSDDLSSNIDNCPSVRLVLVFMFFTGLARFVLVVSATGV